MICYVWVCLGLLANSPVSAVNDVRITFGDSYEIPKGTPVPDSGSVSLYSSNGVAFEAVVGGFAPGEKVVFSYSVKPEQFIALWINTTRSTTFVVEKKGNSITPKTSQGVLIAIVKHTELGCSELNECRFTITITNPALKHTYWKLAGFTGQLMHLNQHVNTVVTRLSMSYFGVYIKQSDLNVKVTLTPNQEIRNMDLDLIISHEDDPLAFLFPDRYAKNHALNYPEEVVIGSESGVYIGDGLYLLQVFASADTPHYTNTFSLQVAQITSTEDSGFFVFGPSLFAIFGGLVFFLICVVSTVVILTRIRRQTEVQQYRQEAIRQLRTHNERIRDNGATEDMLSELAERVFKEGDILAEDAICSICLGCYEDGDKLRELPCAHHFHKGCVDTWLKQRKLCPLCQQRIDTMKKSDRDVRPKVCGLSPTPALIHAPAPATSSDPATPPQSSRRLIVPFTTGNHIPTQPQRAAGVELAPEASLLAPQRASLSTSADE